MSVFCCLLAIFCLVLLIVFDTFATTTVRSNNNLIKQLGKSVTDLSKAFTGVDLNTLLAVMDKVSDGTWDIWFGDENGETEFTVTADLNTMTWKYE